MANNNWAYGFHQYRHLAAERVTVVGAQTIWDAVHESGQEYSRAINSLMAGLVTRTTEHQRRVMLPGSHSLQPLDDAGNPIPVRPSGYYDVAFPMQSAGTAWGTDRISRVKMTVEEANRLTVEAMQADADWMRRHILAAVLYSSSWSFTDPRWGALTIQPLANGDAVKYVRKGGTDPATDTHYLAQAAAIADLANPFPTIHDELMEHPSNGTGEVIVYAATSLKTSIKGLQAFVEVDDADVQKGANSDRITSPIQPGLGDEVLGKVDKCWVVEWKALPAGYMLAHAVDGGPIVTMREHEEGELQGFYPEQFDTDGNTMGTRMLRHAGFGVHNRVGALAYYVGGAAWTNPTGYTAMPLPA